ESRLSRRSGHWGSTRRTDSTNWMRRAGRHQVGRHTLDLATFSNLGVFMRTLTGGAMALAASLVLVAFPSAQAQSKIAFVDGQRIFGSVPGRAEAEAQFNKEMDSVRSKEKIMGDSMTALIADYSKAEPTLSAADKTTKQQSLRDKQAAFQ